MSFISALTGTNKAAESIKNVSASVGSVAKGTGAITKGLDGATKAAEKLKRSTASFDELNVVSKQTSSSSGSGASAPSYSGDSGGMSIGTVDTSGLTSAFDKTSESAERFAKKIKEAFNKLKEGVKEYATLFTPTFDAWKNAFEEIKEPVVESFGSVKSSFGGFLEETLKPFASYVIDEYIPDLTNNFSENFAPIFSDVMSFSVKQFAEDFEWMCNEVDKGVEDIIKPAMETLKTITIDINDTIGNEWEKTGETLLEKFGGFIDSIKGIWNNFYDNILKPVWDIILGAINDIWSEYLKPLWEKILSFFTSLGECILTVWNNFLAPIVNWLITVLAPIVVNIVNTIIGVVKTIIGVIAGVIGGILDALGGLLDFITGIFSGNWKKAWEGIKKFFKGIWDAIWSICKGIINLIIDGINGLWSGIYSVIAALVNGVGSIAGAIGSLFGQDWSFEMPKKAPTIPKLAKGGIVTSETLATIGERGKEAVLPLENNTEWMDVLAEKIANRNNTPSKIVLALDGKELGYATIGAINNITKQTGTLQLAII